MSVNKLLVDWSDEELWATLCDRILLSGQIVKSNYYQSFLEQVRLTIEGGDQILLEVKNDLILGFIQQNLKDVIVTELAVLLTRPVDVNFKINPNLAKFVILDQSSVDDVESAGKGYLESTDKGYSTQATLSPRHPNSAEANNSFMERRTTGHSSPVMRDASRAQLQSRLQSHQPRYRPDDLASSPSSNFDLRHARAEAQINSHLNFDKFIIGSSNNNVYNTALSVANHPGNRMTNPLVIYGSTGLGKTHLLHAIGNHSFECETITRAQYMSSEQFLNHFVKSVKDSSPTPIDKYADLDLMLIDDIQFIIRGEETQVHLIELINLLVQRGKQVVITCDKYPHEIRGEKNKRLHQDLLRRFEDGYVVDVDKPDQATRLEILKQKAEQAAGRLDFFPQEVLKFVSERYTSNVRELEGVVLKLFAYKNMLGREISLDVARVVLGDVRRNVDRKFTLNDIVDAVAMEFKVPVGTIISKSRKAEVMLARKVAMYLSRALTDNSLHTIGVHFERDFSSVQYCVRALMKVLVKDPTLNDRVEALRDQLRGTR